MKPSDTHIERMADTFAERSPYLRETREEAKEAWHKALEFGREEGMLTEIEAHMQRKGTVDTPTKDAWDRAREY